MTAGLSSPEPEDGEKRRVQPITCSGCSATWTALNAAHCTGCHELFASVALFDAHRSQDGERGACIPPAEVQGRNGEQRLFFRAGMWRGPEMPEEAREAFRRLAS
jgi:hypothetical protein